MKNVHVNMETPAIEIIPAQHAEDFTEAKKLILDYASWIGIDLAFQDFDAELNDLQSMYTAPHGGLLLAKVNGRFAGVAGVRKFEGKACELKRMFVGSDYRNLGLGRRLLSACIGLAKKLGYQVIKLDTADFMTAAIKLYQRYGFVEIPAYRHNPHEWARYFELVLKSDEATSPSGSLSVK